MVQQDEATAGELERPFDTTRKSIALLGRQGIIEQTGRGRWKLAASVTGYVRHLREEAAGRGGDDAQAVQAKLAGAQADLAAERVKQMRGEVAPIAEIEAKWTCRSIRARVLAVPDRMRDLPARQHVKLVTALRSALSDLSDGKACSRLSAGARPCCKGSTPEARSGRWWATRPEVTGHHGYRLNALVSLLPACAWGTLAREFVVAKHDPDLLRAFTTTLLAEPWRGAGDDIDEGELASRAESIGLDAIPPDVLALFVDVQLDRLEVTTCGWAKDGTCFILEGIVGGISDTGCGSTNVEMNCSNKKPDRNAHSRASLLGG